MKQSLPQPQVFNTLGRLHLYNLQDDISERTDLATKMPDRVTSMKTRLHAWYKDVNAKFLQPKLSGDSTPWRPAAGTR